MSSINISDIIQVNIAVSPTQVGVDGYGPLMFLSSQFQPATGEQPVRIYGSLDDVLLDFPTGEIAVAATTWYSQVPKPKTFIVAALLSVSASGAAAAGTLTGGGAVTIADLNKVTNGVIRVNIDGQHDIQTGSMDFSKQTDLNTCARNITVQLNGFATCTQTNGVFKITSANTGSSTYVSLVNETPLATTLKLTSATGGVSASGVDAKDITADLTAATTALSAAGQSYYYVALERTQRNYRAILAAKWCEASGKVFGLCTNDAKVLTIGDTTNLFYQAKTANLQRTLNVYDASANGVEYPEISILARASTVNFNVAGSSIILAFKQGPGVTTANLTTAQLTALRSYNGNAFISVGGKVMFYNGLMANGSSWFDTVQGVDWLTAQIQANVFNLFYTSATKVSWTETGVARVNQQVTNALELAVTNGLIAPGYDADGEFYPTGYKVVSTDLSLLQSQKGDRLWQGTSFVAIGAGAIQGAVISGNFVQ